MSETRPRNNSFSLGRRSLRNKKNVDPLDDISPANHLFTSTTNSSSGNNNNNNGTSTHTTKEKETLAPLLTLSGIKKGKHKRKTQHLGEPVNLQKYYKVGAVFLLKNKNINY